MDDGRLSGVEFADPRLAGYSPPLAVEAELTVRMSDGSRVFVRYLPEPDAGLRIAVEAHYPDEPNLDEVPIDLAGRLTRVGDVPDRHTVTVRGAGLVEIEHLVRR